MLVCLESGAARSVYFAAQIGQLAHTLHYPDHARLLANAVRWAAHYELPLRVQAPPGLQISLRRQNSRRLVHLINLAGTRLFDQPVPLHEIRVSLPIESTSQPTTAFLLSNGQQLPFESDETHIHIIIPKVVDYDVLVME
jgi:hypothetical protein